jgi:ribosomal protein L9
MIAISTMQDGYEKNYLLKTNAQKRNRWFGSSKVHADELAKLDEDITKPKKQKDLTKYNAL